MADYETEDFGVGFLSPATLFLILILLMTGTLGGGRRRKYSE